MCPCVGFSANWGVNESNSKQNIGLVQVGVFLSVLSLRFCNFFFNWLIVPLVPTQKMPRLLTTCASAVRRLRAKAVLMAVDVEAEEVREAQVSALADLPKKWHIPPAFSVEFIAYVIDRERRIAQLKEQVCCVFFFPISRFFSVIFTLILTIRQLP